MNIPVDDSLFRDDDFTRVEVQLEPRHVALLKALAAHHETSFDQALRYLLNVGAQHARPPKTDANEDEGETVFDQFRSIAERIEKLNEKRDSKKPREMHNVIRQLLDQHQGSGTSSSRSRNASPSGEESPECDRSSSGPPSMFDVVKKMDENDGE